MTGLQLNVGLFSGINYVELVDQLIKVDSITMDRLALRTERLSLERTALQEMMAKFLTATYPMRVNLNRLQPFLRTDVTSSNPSLIAVNRTGNVAAGSYTFTPIQMASSQQTVAKGVASDTEPLGKVGTITIGKGWSVESEVQLSDINGGEGFVKGSIRLVDGNGMRATIDLRKAVSVNDVIRAINDNDNVDVIAELDGDRIVLRDVSGGDPSKMQVQEVSGGSTAASLGLMGREVSANGVLVGDAIWRLGENMSLSLLNDGMGLVFDKTLPDISIVCRNGDTVNIDFYRWTTQNGVTHVNREMTVGDLLNTINDAGTLSNGTKRLNARISDDGKSIVIEDLTSGGEITSILQSSPNGHPIVKMLGLASNDKTTTIDLFTGLLKDGDTAKMSFTDKAGNTATIEFTQKDIDAIYGTIVAEGAKVGSGNLPDGYTNSIIASAFNVKLEKTDVQMRFIGTSTTNGNNGIYIIDSSGGDGAMTIKDLDTDLLSRLGLANAQETQGISMLSGATPGTIRFTDQTGKNVTVGITRGELDAIESAEDLYNLFAAKLGVDDDGIAKDVGIQLVFNDAGTGIMFKDITGGTANAMTIMDSGGSNIAARLGLSTTRYNPNESTAIANSLEGVTAGEIRLTDGKGNSTTIEIEQNELEGITSLRGLRDLINGKIDAVNAERVLEGKEKVDIDVEVNAGQNALFFRDQSKGNTQLMEIEDVSGDVIEKLGFKSTQTSITSFLANTTPGEITFRDQTGKSADIAVTRAQLDAITSLEELADLFNEQLDEAGIGIVAALDGAGTGLIFKDTTGSTATWQSISDKGAGNLATRLGLTGTTTGVGDFLAGVTPGKVSLTDQRGGNVEIELTQSDLDSVTSLQGLATLFNNKITEQNVAQQGTGNYSAVSVQINNAGNGLYFIDSDYKSAPIEIVDTNGGDIIARLGLTTTQTSNGLPYMLETTTPGEIRFTDQNGNSAEITIEETDLEGIESLADLATLLNDKLEAVNAKRVEDGEPPIGIEIGLDAKGTSLYFKDTTGGASVSAMNIVGVTSNLIAQLGLKSDMHANIAPIAVDMTPGTIRITDQAGNSAEVTFTQDMLDEWGNNYYNYSLGWLEYHIKTQLDDAGVEVDLGLVWLEDGIGRGFSVKDNSGGTGSLTIEAVDKGDGLGLTNIADLLGIAGEFDEGEVVSGNIVYDNLMSSQVAEYALGSVEVGKRILESNAIEIHTINSGALASQMAQSHAVETQGLIYGSTNVTGTFQTRDLLGGLDTVLMSSLNGGLGLDKAKAGGLVEVQDRAGNKASLTFTQSELNSMQTLSDSVKIINQKIAAAGVKVTVRINDDKTGLQVVDNSGSTSHNLIFRDVAVNTPQPGTGSAAVAEIPAIDAKSGNTGGSAAVSNGSGAAKLDFGNTSLLNGFTFVFTDEQSDEGYDAANKKFTFYLDVAAIEAESDDEVRNQMVKDAIDNLIAAHWDDISPSATIPPPEVKLTATLGDNALADVAAGDKETAITTASGGTLGKSEGTAVLTFEGTHWMNGFTFGFTTEASASGYYSTEQKFNVLLTQAILDATDPAERDKLVKEAIDNTIAAGWAALPSSIFGGVTPPKVKQVAGLSAQAITDAFTGGETAIKTTVDGAVMGQTHVPGIPAVPETVVSSESNIASSFGLNVNAASSRVGGSSLNRQIVSYATLLSDLNGGAGVNMKDASITISDSSTAFSAADPERNIPARHLGTATITFDSTVKTVGDLIEFINIRVGSIKVVAKLNDAGDGIVFEEFAGGSRNFTISDADSNSKFASSLGIAGSVSAAKKDEDGRARITASEKHNIEIEATDSLNDIRDKINEKTGYSASVLSDGSSTPYRLSVSSKQTGAAGKFNIDLSAIGLATETMNVAKDAMIVYGDANQSNSLVMRSSTNSFRGLINGADLTITGVSDSPVTITSASSNLDVKTSLKLFVEQYNEFREKLNEDMYFRVTNEGIEGNILWNSSVAKAFDREVTKMFMETIEGIPGIRSLADLGIKIRPSWNDEGLTFDTSKLEFDEEKFEEAWRNNQEAVQQFFFNEREVKNANGTTSKVNTGWAQRFSDTVDRLVGNGDIVGATPSRIDTLDTQITRNEDRIAFLEQRLEFKRQMYLNQFYAMEQALARMSSDMSAVSNMASTWQSNFSTGG